MYFDRNQFQRSGLVCQGLHTVQTDPLSPALVSCAIGDVDVAVIGGGPSGLMAAEVLSAQGVSVHVFDGMPSVGRKFLLAGRGGLNLTHAEPWDAFVGRFGDKSGAVGDWLNQFGAEQVRIWARALGVETFVGSSGRVFPSEMKAAPLLRAWIHRLRHAQMPVQFHMRHRWVGWSDAGWLFDTPQGCVHVQSKAVVLALGGASWSRLGSDGAWVPQLKQRGIQVESLQPANCGFDVMGRSGQGWTAHFKEKFAGQAFKTVAIRWVDERGHSHHQQGEFVATSTGVEGSLIYSAARDLREAGLRGGQAHFELDLLPHRTLEFVQAAVAHPKGTRSLSSHLKSRLGLEGIKMALLYELLDATQLQNPQSLSHAIKSLPVLLVRARPLDEAISTAGGVALSEMDEHLMLHKIPGVFCAGEMLDWEAPTGGYLLTACMASGYRVGHSVRQWLELQETQRFEFAVRGDEP